MTFGDGPRLTAHYLVGEELGRGAFGVVSRARRRSDGRVVACKRVAMGSLSASSREKAWKEAGLLKELDSPFIVRYLEAFLESGYLHIVTEFCDGGSLAGLLHRRKKASESSSSSATPSGAAPSDRGDRETPRTLSTASNRSTGELPSGLGEETVQRVACQILLGLEYLHARRVLHRDVKPANVFLTKLGDAVLGDLGVAKVLFATADQAETFIGSPAYMAPEIIEQEPYGEASDVWSFGVIAFEMCAGRRAFEAPNFPALCMRVLSLEAPPQLAANSGYSDGLKCLITRCLARSPKDRPVVPRLLQEELFRGIAAEVQSSARESRLRRCRSSGAVATSGAGSSVPPVLLRHPSAPDCLQLRCRSVSPNFSASGRPAAGVAVGIGEVALQEKTPRRASGTSDRRSSSRSQRPVPKAVPVPEVSPPKSARGMEATKVVSHTPQKASPSRVWSVPSKAEKAAKGASAPATAPTPARASHARRSEPVRAKAPATVKGSKRSAARTEVCGVSAKPALRQTARRSSAPLSVWARHPGPVVDARRTSLPHGQPHRSSDPVIALPRALVFAESSAESESDDSPKCLEIGPESAGGVSAAAVAAAARASAAWFAAGQPDAGECDAANDRGDANLNECAAEFNNHSAGPSEKDGSNAGTLENLSLTLSDADSLSFSMTVGSERAPMPSRLQARLSISLVDEEMGIDLVSRERGVVEHNRNEDDSRCQLSDAVAQVFLRFGGEELGHLERVGPGRYRLGDRRLFCRFDSNARVLVRRRSSSKFELLENVLVNGSLAQEESVPTSFIEDTLLPSREEEEPVSFVLPWVDLVSPLSTPHDASTQRPIDLEALLTAEDLSRVERVPPLPGESSGPLLWVDRESSAPLLWVDLVSPPSTPSLELTQRPVSLDGDHVAQGVHTPGVAEKCASPHCTQHQEASPPLIGKRASLTPTRTLASTQWSIAEVASCNNSFQDRSLQDEHGSPTATDDDAVDAALRAALSVAPGNSSGDSSANFERVGGGRYRWGSHRIFCRLDTEGHLVARRGSKFLPIQEFLTTR